MQITNLDYLNSYILDCFPQEGCGLVIDSTFVSFPNIASNPVDSFKMEQGTYLTYEKVIDCIVHSHTFIPKGVDPRTPSRADISLAKATGLPQGILHTDGKIVSDILFYNTLSPVPLLDRPYIAKVYDCYELVKDFLFTEFDHKIAILPREDNWAETEPTLMVDNLTNQGLVKIPAGRELIYGDIVVFRIASNLPNHVGVYVGNDRFLHHLNNRLSCEDSLDKWSKHIHSNYRLLR